MIKKNGSFCRIKGVSRSTTCEWAKMCKKSKTTAFYSTCCIFLHQCMYHLLMRMCSILIRMLILTLAQLLSAHAIGAVGLGFKSRVGQIGSMSLTDRHRCDVSSELCCPGDERRRWALPLVICFGVTPRV